MTAAAVHPAIPKMGMATHIMEANHKRSRRNARQRARKRSRHEQKVLERQDQYLYWQASLDPQTLEGQCYIEEAERLETEPITTSQVSEEGVKSTDKPVEETPSMFGWITSYFW